MHAPCAVNPELARKNASTILQRLSSVGQRPVADALSVSEATVSRMKGEGLETFTGLLGALLLKVVPVEMQCYEREYVDNLRYFAKLGMALHDGTQQIPTKLSFEDAAE